MRTNDFAPNSICRTAFFAGHRDLVNEHTETLKEVVYQCLLDAYRAGYRRFFCGCAIGFDTLAAFQTIRLREEYPDVCLSLAIPCPDQSLRWSASDQEIYRKLIASADEKIILSPVYYQGVMLTRNRYMADQSSLCICLLRNLQGGTASAVRYALKHKNMKIINLAVPDPYSRLQMRENIWSYIYISHSAGRNADTVHLRLSQGRKRISRHT